MRNNFSLYQSNITLAVIAYLSLFVGCGGVGVPTGTDPQFICAPGSIAQITDETWGDSSYPSIDAKGVRIAFQSTANINGGNPDGNTEIYRFDAASYTTTITTGTITQITDETAGNSTNPSINLNGSSIVFESTANINGGNPRGGSEIFYLRGATGRITQITNHIRPSASPSIDEGGKIAFVSSANINGGNPEENQELYLYDTRSGMFTQITNTEWGSSFYPSISTDGTRIAFGSRANINGGNPDSSAELYLYDTRSGMFTQITNGNSSDYRSDWCVNSSLSIDGMRIAFQCTANIDGGNPDGNGEIYFYDTGSGTFTQITNETEGISLGPSMNDIGRHIAFASWSNIDGGNPDRSTEIFYYDTIEGIFHQVTNETEGISLGPSINKSGNRVAIAFSSSANINGGNPDGNREIFVFVTVCP